MIAGKDILHRAHGALVLRGRARVVVANLAQEIPVGAEVLDVGTGDASIDREIALRPDIKIEGIEILSRPRTHISVHLFDGEHIPLFEKAVDVVCFGDVLHHISDARILLLEATRVSRRYIVIKDHLRDGPFLRATLQATDWVGNYGHGLALPYNYLSKQEWRERFRNTSLIPERWTETLRLYSVPFSLVFHRRLHFIARLMVRSTGHAAVR